MSEEVKRETPKAAAAFAEYCALGPSRSLAKLVLHLRQKGGKKAAKLRTLETWSSDFNWQERVRQYDRERAEEKRLEREATLDAMNTRHASLALEAQEKARAQITALIAAKSFGSQAAVQLLKLGIDAERLARGAPTDRTEQTGPGGAALPAAQVTIWIPDNGRDGYATKGGESN